MTSRGAASTGGGFLEPDGNIPIAEGGFFPDMFFPGPGVDFMAGPAGSPFLQVHMDIMKVPVTVPEIGKGGGFLCFCQGTFMALEADTVFFNVIGGVEFPGKLPDEEFIKVRTVGIMAARTVSIFNGTVFLRVVGNDFIYVVILPVGPDDRLVMAIEAEVEWRLSQVIFIDRTVGVVTIKTTSFLLDNGVLKFRRGGFVYDRFMTFAAKVFRRVEELVLEIGGVGTVAAGTALLHGRVHVFAPPGEILIRMTADANILFGRNQQRFVVGSMGFVTDGAVAGRVGTVNKFFSHGFLLMTFEA